MIVVVGGVWCDASNAGRARADRPAGGFGLAPRAGLHRLPPVCGYRAGEPVRVRGGMGGGRSEALDVVSSGRPAGARPGRGVARWRVGWRSASVAMVMLAGCSAGSKSPPRVAQPIHGASGGLLASRADAFLVQPQPAPGSCHAWGAAGLSLPDPRCTPGAIDPSVTPQNIHTTICRRGYSDAVRPPQPITEAEKRASLLAYGDPGSAGGYEYDHLIPLGLGGARNDPRNLWPQPGPTPNRKDSVEGNLHAAVCSGRLSLRAAQARIATDWRSAAAAGSLEGPGSNGHSGDVAFCSNHSCIANFPYGHGSVIQCQDGRWSHSGGRTGVCNNHGGPRLSSRS